MKYCNLCPRQCNVEREITPGFCLAKSQSVLSKIMLHQWEEPFISGETGTGALFFSGCTLRCLFCQNWTISHQVFGRSVTKDELKAAIYDLKERGAVSISFITASHFLEALIPLLEELKGENFPLPLVWNSSAYETPDSLQKLAGLIDIYLPDYKFYDSQVAKRLALAEDYPRVARLAISEMVRQTGPLQFSGDLLKRGTVIRHLVLPGQVSAAQSILADIQQSYGQDVFVSLMNQYTPMGKAKSDPELNRPLKEEEYEEVVDYALTLGMENVLLQSSESQSDAFTPDFTVYDGGSDAT